MRNFFISHLGVRQRRMSTMKWIRKVLGCEWIVNLSLKSIFRAKNSSSFIMTTIILYFRLSWTTKKIFIRVRKFILLSDFCQLIKMWKIWKLLWVLKILTQKCLEIVLEFIKIFKDFFTTHHKIFIVKVLPKSYTRLALILWQAFNSRNFCFFVMRKFPLSFAKSFKVKFRIRSHVLSWGKCFSFILCFFFILLGLNLKLWAFLYFRGDLCLSLEIFLGFKLSLSPHASISHSFLNGYAFKMEIKNDFCWHILKFMTQFTLKKAKSSIHRDVKYFLINIKKRNEKEK